MKKIYMLFASLFLSTAIANAQTITVAAAANLKFALDDIALAFTKESGIDVKIITGASGKLTQQILSGAPFDAFLSADIEYPTKLSNAGLTLDPPKVYAYGSLVLWSNTGIDLSKGMAIINDISVKKIAIANPKTAPYGIEAMNVLNYYRLTESTLPKIINAESISQVGAYVSTKSVDVGFIAKSIVVSPEMKNIGRWIEINPKSYHVIDQAMVGLKSGSTDNQIATQKFLRFMSSNKARSILKTNGYILPAQ